MGPLGVVLDTPGFDLLAGVAQRKEPVLVQTLAAEPAVEALDEGVMHRLVGFDEPQGDACEIYSNLGDV